MANTNVFRGSDGALVLAVDAGAEGEQAQAIIDAVQPDACRTRQQRRGPRDLGV